MDDVSTDEDNDPPTLAGTTSVVFADGGDKEEFTIRTAEHAVDFSDYVLARGVRFARIEYAPRSIFHIDERYHRYRYVEKFEVVDEEARCVMYADEAEVFLYKKNLDGTAITVEQAEDTIYLFFVARDPVDRAMVRAIATIVAAPAT